MYVCKSVLLLYLPGKQRNIQNGIFSFNLLFYNYNIHKYIRIIYVYILYLKKNKTKKKHKFKNNIYCYKLQNRNKYFAH